MHRNTLRTSLTALVVLVALAAGPAVAREVAGVNLPEQVTVGEKTLALNGAGVRVKVIVKVYVGALYLEHKSTDASAIVMADETKRVVLHFVHSKVDKGKLVNAWKEGFEANSKANLAALGERIEKFNGMMADVVAGDRIELTYVPGEGTHVSVKGKEVGVIEGKDFADALFLIWLGPKPAHEGLKKAMLHG